MAYFTAIGVISNDIVRRETKSGVVTTFRLETGDHGAESSGSTSNVGATSPGPSPIMVRKDEHSSYPGNSFRENGETGTATAAHVILCAFRMRTSYRRLRQPWHAKTRCWSLVGSTAIRLLSKLARA